MWVKVALGILLGFLVGVGCQAFGIPSPAPTAIMGAVLVLAMTVGYVAADRFLVRPAATTEHLCGGPNGRLPRAPRRRGR